MARVRWSVSVVVLAGLVSLFLACSSGGANHPYEEGADCSNPNSLHCGTSAMGSEAVLLCNADGLLEIWEGCTGSCSTDTQGTPTCMEDGDTASLDAHAKDTRELPDVALDGAELPPDLVDFDSPYIISDQTTFPDLKPDLVAPTLLSSDPADGQGNVPVPFVVKMTFSEPIYEATVAPQTIRVEDGGGKTIQGQYELQGTGDVVLFTPTSPVFHASPYRVVIGPMLSDPAGNKFGTEVSFSFSTGSPPGMEGYKAIAAKFSPVVYGETGDGPSQFDYPTVFDLDDDWDGSDNVSFIKSDVQSVVPSVYYSVVETKSHWFITYAYFWPYRNNPDVAGRFGNDMAGAVVVVRKVDKVPVILETWFKTDTSEISDAYVSSAFTMVPADGNPLDYGFEDRFLAGDLFPNGHYPAYLAKDTHQSCLWIDMNNTIFDGCLLNTGLKNAMNKIQYVYGSGEEDVLQKQGSSWPTNLQGIRYQLVPILDTLWARRDRVGPDMIWDNEFSYAPFQGRPNVTTKIPGTFVDPIGNDHGRPPWAWKWQPGNGESYYDMTRGGIFLDPAAFFSVRHNKQGDWPDYDAATGQGWSFDYCFNPYFNLDFRGIDPECPID